MSTATAPKPVTQTVDADPDAALLDRIIESADLSKLSVAERGTYYRHVCRSLDLNALTKPFEYLLLKDRETKQDKLVLYATKTCTDQLRDKRNISVKVIEKKTEDGVYIVTAQATEPSGRVDVDDGAVPIEREEGEWKNAQSGKRYFQGNGTWKPIRGEALANAKMKAMTKAKRRVTLSICGLGWLDESEVDSIPNARRVEVRADGEIENEALQGTDLDAAAKTSAEMLANVLPLLNAAYTNEMLAAIQPPKDAVLAVLVEADRVEFETALKFARARVAAFKAACKRITEVRDASGAASLRDEWLNNVGLPQVAKDDLHGRLCEHEREFDPQREESPDENMVPV